MGNTRSLDYSSYGRRGGYHYNRQVGMWPRAPFKAIGKALWGGALPWQASGRYGALGAERR